MSAKQLRRAWRGGAGSAGRMWAWRAHAYGAPSELRLEEARVPALRAPDDVLVRVLASSINPLDVAMIGGYGARLLNVWRGAAGGGDVDVEFPLVVGRDLVGRVERAGPQARVAPGDRVWAALPPHVAGAHAQYALLKDAWTGPAPETFDDAQAGGALYAALSALAVLRAARLWPVRARPRVLLLGLGGVGQAALQLLAAGGASVVVGAAGELAEAARDLGAHLALDRHRPDYGELARAAGPYDAVVDCAGLGGREAGAGRWRFARYATLTSPLLRETDARGAACGAVAAAAELAAQNAATGGAPVRWAYFGVRREDVATLRALATRGAWRVRAEATLPWWRADEAYERAARGHARGKLLLDFAAVPPDEL